MKSISHNDEVGSDGGDKLINTNPGSGTITVFRSLPDGGFSTDPYMTIDSSSSESNKIFYLPTPKGMSWKFELTVDATAAYSKHQTRMI